MLFYFFNVYICSTNRFWMKKALLTILIACSLSIVAFAQHWKTAPIELYGGLSGIQYFGDIGGTASKSSALGILDFKFANLRPGINLGARYQIAKPLYLRGSYNFGVLSASDKNSRNAGRDFAFNTIINQLAVGVDIHIIPESDENYYYSIMRIRGGFRHYRQPLSLYATLGAGALFFHVMPNETLAASPRFEKKWITLAVPVGVGIKYAIMPQISAGAELLLNYTTTDYLDGYTSPYSKFGDIYYSFNLKVNYKIQKTTRRHIGVPRRRAF